MVSPHFLGKLLAAPSLHLPPGDTIEQNVRLQWEKQLLGLYISAHPLEKVAASLPGGIITINEALQLKGKEREAVRIVGIVNTSRRVITKNGEPMQFGMLEDATGSIEMIVFPKAMAEIKTVIEEGAVIEVTGSISSRNGEKKCIAEKVTAFESQFISITLDAKTPKQTLLDIKQLLKGHPGAIPVYVNIGDRSIKADSLTSQEAVAPLVDLLGQEAVGLVY